MTGGQSLYTSAHNTRCRVLVGEPQLREGERNGNAAWVEVRASTDSILETACTGYTYLHIRHASTV